MSQMGPYVVQKGKLSRQSLIGEWIIEKFKEVNGGDSTKKWKGRRTGVVICQQFRFHFSHRAPHFSYIVVLYNDVQYSCPIKRSLYCTHLVLIKHLFSLVSGCSPFRRLHLSVWPQALGLGFRRAGKGDAGSLFTPAQLAWESMQPQRRCTYCCRLLFPGSLPDAVQVWKGISTGLKEVIALPSRSF